MRGLRLVGVFNPPIMALGRLAALHAARSPRCQRDECNHHGRNHVLMQFHGFIGFDFETWVEWDAPARLQRGLFCRTKHELPEGIQPRYVLQGTGRPV